MNCENLISVSQRDLVAAFTTSITCDAICDQVIGICYGAIRFRSPSRTINV